MDSSDESALLRARFFSNMKRVDGLIALTLPSRPIGKGPSSKEEAARDDIGRAVVVFLHATFEDMLRTLARQRLVAAGPEVLTRLPLRLRGEKEKFALGSLAAHRGKTIDELLKEAVSDFLDRESFPTCDSVENILRCMDLETEPFKFLYPGLASMMKRRHQIVHNADLRGPTDTEVPAWRAGDDLLMTYWLLHVMTFYWQLRVSLNPNDDLSRWFLAKRTSAIERAREMFRQIEQLTLGPRANLLDGLRWISDSLAALKDLFAATPSEDELLQMARKMSGASDSNFDRRSQP